MNELALPPRTLNELALFAGAGGGLLGTALLGWRPVCAVEIEPYCREVLLRRQRDGLFPLFPIWDDIRTFDGRPWYGLVDIVTGGFPCQDISSAGRGAGINGKYSGLWAQMARVIGEVRPRFALMENSPVLTSRGLDRILGDLAEMGFDAKWGIVSAAEVGAPHKRERIWILAYTNKNRREWAHLPLQPRHQVEADGQPAWGSQAAPDSSSNGLEGKVRLGDSKKAHSYDSGSAVARRTVPTCWQGDHPEPGILGMDDGVAHWKHRIAALGEGQVPGVVQAAWELLNFE